LLEKKNVLKALQNLLNEKDKKEIFHFNLVLLADLSVTRWFFSDDFWIDFCSWLHEKKGYVYCVGTIRNNQSNGKDFINIIGSTHEAKKMKTSKPKSAPSKFLIYCFYSQKKII